MNLATPDTAGIATRALEVLHECRTANANLGYREDTAKASEVTAAIDRLITIVENGGLSAKSMLNLIRDFDRITAGLERLDEEGAE